MAYHQEENKPLLTPIKNGWAAHGDGWAVHGHTREEAIEKFREAERRHQQIDARPFWFEQQDAQSMYEGSYDRIEETQTRQETQFSRALIQ